jgi:hypothetical protein
MRLKKAYKGDSENEGHSFRVDSKEMILECEDNVNIQIWIIEKGLCDNVAYAFYPEKHSELKFSFPSQERMCLFFPFLESKFDSPTIKINHKYFIYEPNLNVVSSNDDDNQAKTETPFFIYFNSSKLFEKVELKIDFGKNQDHRNDCNFEQFSSFDFENGFISKK